MKMLKRFENYFLAEETEEIQLSDRVWFYGTYGSVAFVTVMMAISTFI